MSKRNVSFSKPPEPSFIRKLKERVGYQDGPTVETKKRELPVSEDSDDDGFPADERPTIVVLDKGDLSAEEYYKEVKKQDEAVKADLSEKIVFRKPKRENENPLCVSTKKARTEQENSLSDQNTRAKIKNSSLLSFDDEDDEDEKN